MSWRRWAPRVATLLSLSLAVGCASTRAPGASAWTSSHDGRVEATAAIDEYVQSLMESEGWPSASVAVITPEGVEYARAYGYANVKKRIPATPQTRYAIGSLTKPLVATALLIAEDSGRIDLNDRVWDRLPPTVSRSRSLSGLMSPRITLGDLASHVAGFPRLPPNLDSNPNDKYAGYSCQKLLTGLGRARLKHPGRGYYRYSNFGYSTLGYILAGAYRTSFENMLRSVVLVPLGMRATYFGGERPRDPRRAMGYRSGDPLSPQRLWNHGCLKPQGAVIASAEDLARFVHWSMRPESPRLVAPKRVRELWRPRHRTDRAVSSGEGRAAQEARDGFGGSRVDIARARVKASSHIGLGWHVRVRKATGEHIVEHAGLVGGFASYMGFVPERQVGIVVLVNRQKSIGSKAARLLTWLAFPRS